MCRTATISQRRGPLEDDGASAWCSPPEDLALGIDEVHVWRAVLNHTDAQVSDLRRTLSDDECERARRFRFRKDRHRFIAAHGILRNILGRYLRSRRERIRFTLGSYGKPELESKVNSPAVCFNMTHSYEIALFAVTYNRNIGVDVELVRRGFQVDEIAGRFFSPLEVASLRACPRSLREEQFFSCWTRKEAFLKATGKGLTVELDQFDVSVGPGLPTALLNTRWDPQESSRWSLRELSVGDGYVGALAVEGNGWRLRFWKWQV